MNITEQKDIERKEVMQSYIWTMMRRNFNIYEMRICVKIVEMMQHILSGQKLNRDLRCTINKQMLLDLYEVTIPIAEILQGEEDKHHKRIKNALVNLSRKETWCEDEKEWKLIRLIELPKITKYGSYVKFMLHQEVFDALLNFSKGFKKFEIRLAMSLKSVYALRFYELFSKQTEPLIFTIHDLKLWFSVEDKYKNNADFIKRVIVGAKKELDEKSPYSFNYKPIKSGYSFTSIKFYPIIVHENYDEAFEILDDKKDLQKLSPSKRVGGYLDPLTLNYLRDHYYFSNPELKNNAALFKTAQQEIPDLLLFLSEVKPKANRALNPKGYLINALKKKLNIQTTKKQTKKYISKEAAQEELTEAEKQQVQHLQKLGDLFSQG